MLKDNEKDNKFFKPRSITPLPFSYLVGRIKQAEMLTNYFANIDYQNN